MSVDTASLFTAALGLVAPWRVSAFALSADKRRIDFTLSCAATHVGCPRCGAACQPVHDRLSREWRHLDFFQYEAWLHADIPRVACRACGKTTQIDTPWARPGSGFTLLFEALAVALCQDMPVAPCSRLLRVNGARLWRSLDHYVHKARAQDDMSGVRHIGIDETSTHKGHHYLTVVHDLQTKRLLFATPGRDAGVVQSFTEDLRAHQGQPEHIEHVCMDMSRAYITGISQALPQAAICFDRFHVAVLAGAAMDAVRVEEIRADRYAFMEAFECAPGTLKPLLRALRWGTRRNPSGWSAEQQAVMEALTHSRLKSARAWRLKMALQDVYAQARVHHCAQTAAGALKAWLAWAQRSRLEPFTKLARTIKTHWAGVVAGMTGGRNNAYVEAMNGLLQQAKVAARGFRTTKNFILIAYLRMAKLQHLPLNPFGQTPPAKA